MMIVYTDINGTPHKFKSGQNIDFRVLAKHVGQRWMVMASNEGDLFNPNDINDNLSKRDKERGSDFFRLQNCSIQCYKQYTAFLRSKNKTHYLIAQRRFRNDF